MSDLRPTVLLTIGELGKTIVEQIELIKRKEEIEKPFIKYVSEGGSRDYFVHNGKEVGPYYNSYLVHNETHYMLAYIKLLDNTRKWWIKIGKL